LNLTKTEIALINVVQGRMFDDTPQTLRVTRSEWECVKVLKEGNSVPSYTSEVDFD
jgi:hypothetical protein